MDLSHYLDKIRTEIEKSPVLNKYAEMLHEKTSISPEVFVVGLGVLLAFMLFFGIFPGFICNVVGVVYPFYQSIKIIEMKQKEGDKQWLVYWVVYGVIECFETFITIITYWIPFYYPLKLVFLVWCMHPTYKGATLIYSSFLRDLLHKHIDTVESIIGGPTDSKKSD